MSIRRVLTAYVLLNAGLYVYSFLRYGFPPDAFSWSCVAFGVFVLVLLVRGSRGAWVLSFFGSTFALVFGVAVLLREEGLILEWALVTCVYATQIAILLTPDVREYIRRASYERAIKAHRSW